MSDRRMDIDVVEQEEAVTRGRGRPKLERPEPDLSGPVVETTATEIRFSWTQVGEITLDTSNRPLPPRFGDDVGGVYRMRFLVPSKTEKQYIGQTGSLEKRFGANYRSPSESAPTQATNRKVRDEIVTTVKAGGIVRLDLMSAASASVDGAGSVALDLQRSHHRHALEGTAVARAELARVELLNHRFDQETD